MNRLTLEDATLTKQLTESLDRASLDGKPVTLLVEGLLSSVRTTWPDKGTDRETTDLTFVAVKATPVGSLSELLEQNEKLKAEVAKLSKALRGRSATVALLEHEIMRLRG